MDRLVLPSLAILLGCGVAGRAAAEPESDLRQALALQQTVQKVIERAEPSVVCILVSRSDLYKRWYNDTPPADKPGELGTFDPTRQRVRFPAGDAARRDALITAAQKRLGQPLEGYNLDQALQAELKRRLDLSDPDYMPASYGSGVAVSRDGLVLTNYHVVRGATKLYVRLPGGKGSYANIHAADPRSDLAVLRLLDQAVQPLTPLRRGDASGIRKGEFVVSIANPFAAGFRDGSPSASWGIISNVRRRAPTKRLLSDQDRRYLSLPHYGMLLQTDARISLGCSGGALVNLKGEWIGLTTALAAVEGGDTPGGFAVPLDGTMNRIIDVLVRGEEVEYGFLGITFERQQLLGQEGVRVKQVVGNSPAHHAGLGPWDTVVAVNDQPIRDPNELFLAIGAMLAGTQVRLKVVDRFRGERTVPVRLTKFYEPKKGIAANPRPFAHGVRVDYSSVLWQRDYQGRPGMVPGVYVAEVQPGSEAARKRLEGMVIMAVNGHPVRDPNEFYQAVRAADRSGAGLELRVVHGSGEGGAQDVKLD